MIVIGIGCRKECEAVDIAALVKRILKENNRTLTDVALLATSWRKGEEASLPRAARLLKLPLAFVIQDALEAVSDAAFTRSERVQLLHGIPSVSETAALAMAGRNAKLLAPRLVSPAVVCALAEGDGV